MYSHCTASCKQPRCLLCGAKTHDTEDHTHREKQNCVNCRGEHPSNHKECNACRNCLGLKPIPSNKEKLQTNKPRPRYKGKDKQTPNAQDDKKGNAPDIRLMNEEISNIMWVDNLLQAIKENTVRFIHTQAMKNLNDSCLTTTPSPSQRQNTTTLVGLSQGQNSMEIEDQCRW